MRRVWAGLMMLAAAAGAGAQVVDAARVTDVTKVDAAWRFHAGDDPGSQRFAEPGFDDSAWPLLKPAQTLASAGLPEVHGGSVWLRLRVEDAMAPLGIDLATTIDPATTAVRPYEVYANGRRIATSPGWAERALSNHVPFAIALPSAGDTVVLVHLYGSPRTLYRVSPLSAVEIGPLSSIANATELARLKNFNENGLAESVEALAFLVLALVGLLLFLAQRDHAEYLWLCLLMVDMAAYLLLDVAMGLGALTTSLPLVLAGDVLGFALLALSLQFVIKFSQVRPKWFLRLLFLFFALIPVTAVLSILQRFYTSVLLVDILLWTVAVSACLIDAYRRGRSESGLLLPTFGVFGALYFMAFLSRLLPALDFFARSFKAAHVAIALPDAGNVLFLGGLLLVVLLRFIRVSKEQRRSEAEFEAARTVQQVLIPEELPQIAGLRIESVYKPAQQVGGDFFQIIPAEDGAALVVMGDVSGKGMQAAMTVSLLVGAVRTEAEHTSSPGRLMQMLNRRSYGRGSSFTTCMILHVARDGEVTAANAGHLQPYLGGREVALEAGLPLGFDVDAEYAETRFALAPGATLTLLTDGVVEATNAQKELFGFARTEAVSTLPALDIASAAERFAAPAVQADDITVLTLVRVG